MRLTLLILFALAPAAHATTDFFPSALFCQESPADDSNEAMNKLMAKIATQHSAMIGRDLGGAVSIWPINHAIAALHPKEICASGIALSKNIYGYHEYLLTFRLTLGSGEIRLIPVLFQASSVQGHHGIGLNPWSGVPRSGLLALADRKFSALDFHPTTAMSLAELLRENLPTRENEEIEEGSVSLVPILDSAGATKYFVVGEFYRIPNDNPFLEISASRGLALRETSEGWQVAVIGSLFEFYQSLDELKRASAPANNSNETVMDKLIEISK